MSNDPTRDAIDAAEAVIVDAQDLDARLRRMGMKLTALVDHLDQLRQARDDADE